MSILYIYCLTLSKKRCQHFQIAIHWNLLNLFHSRGPSSFQFNFFIYTERNCNAHIGGIIRIKIITLKFTYMSPTIAIKWVRLNLPVGFRKRFFREHFLKFDEKCDEKNIFQKSGNIFRNSMCAVACAVSRLANADTC